MSRLPINADAPRAALTLCAVLHLPLANHSPRNDVMMCAVVYRVARSSFKPSVDSESPALLARGSIPGESRGAARPSASRRARERRGEFFEGQFVCPLSIARLRCHCARCSGAMICCRTDSLLHEALKLCVDRARARLEAARVKNNAEFQPIVAWPAPESQNRTPTDDWDFRSNLALALNRARQKLAPFQCPVTRTCPNTNCENSDFGSALTPPMRSPEICSWSLNPIENGDSRLGRPSQTVP